MFLGFKNHGKCMCPLVLRFMAINCSLVLRFMAQMYVSHGFNRLSSAHQQKSSEKVGIKKYEKVVKK